MPPSSRPSPSPGPNPAVTYSAYLHLDELLALQQRRSDGPEHDEMLFIIIHQVYELWFKQVLHEIGLLRTTLEGNDTPRTLHTFKRILTILKTLVAQVDILETMTPLSFSSFRGRLESASGFQSAQFREMEIILGERHRALASAYPPGSEIRRRVEARFDEPTLYESFLRFLVANKFAVPEEAIRANRARGRLVESPEVQRLLIDAYRANPTIASVCERLVDLDEGIQEWRYRHVKMVERTIGTKPGTGGSAGADYLRSTLFKPLFPDLWAIRISL